VATGVVRATIRGEERDDDQAGLYRVGNSKSKRIQAARKRRAYLFHRRSLPTLAAASHGADARQKESGPKATSLWAQLWFVCSKGGKGNLPWQFQVSDGSALGEERLDVRFDIGAVHDTDVCGGDAAASVDQIGDRECGDRIALRDSVVAH